jgi:2,4-dienoyl-CoA reductase-like NADH-dependent reductase (Old Yellow Enzyme family)
MEIRNRIVMLPMTTGYTEPDETVGAKFIDFFAERARGGAGLIVIPFSPVKAGSPVEPGLFDDRFIPGVRRLTSSIHDFGARAAAQLITSYHVVLKDDQPEVVAPSAVLNQLMRVMPRALTVEEIHYIVGEYGKAARRAREGGFDAVEILVGGGYLLNRFLSPITNKREDRYGGSLENRMRIILEAIESMKREAGEDFIFGCRLNVEEQNGGGTHRRGFEGRGAGPGEGRHRLDQLLHRMARIAATYRSALPAQGGLCPSGRKGQGVRRHPRRHGEPHQ